MNKLKEMILLDQYYLTEKHLKLPKHVTVFINQINTAKEIYLKDKSEANIRSLNNLFWALTASIVHMHVLKGDLNGLAFVEPEKLFLDFGLLSEKLFEPDEEFMNTLLSDYQPRKKERFEIGEDLVIYHFSEVIITEYLKMMKVKENNELVANLKALEAELISLPDKILTMQRSRNNIQAASLHSKELVELTKNIESNVIQFYQLTKKRDQGGAFTSGERQKLAEFQFLMDKWKNRKAFFIQDLTKVGADERLRQLDKEIEISLMRRVDIKDKITSLLKELSSQNEDRAKLIKGAERGNQMLARMIEQMKDIMDLVAKRDFRVGSSVLLSKAQIILKSDVLRVVRMAEELDPNLFSNVKSSFSGKPMFVICPGVGNGVYDWKRNYIIIPVVPITTIEESIIAALLDYRLSVDSEHALEQSYYKIHPELAKTGMVKFRKAFLVDYVTWILKEGSGVMVFKQAKREWFEKTLSVLSSELRIPKYLQPRLKTATGTQKLEQEAKNALEKNPEDAQAKMVLAFAACAKDNYELAIRHFNSVLNFLPDDLIANYNLALVYELAGIKQDAIVQYKSYMALDKGSWFRTNAQRRLMNLTSK